MPDIPTDTRSRSVMDCQLQVVTVPVTDVDLAAAFYTQQAGFVLDVDYHPTPGFRVVQLTPPARPARSRSAPGSPTRHPDRRGPPTWPSPTLKPPAVNSPDAASASAPSATSHPSTAGKATGSPVPTRSAATMPASPASPTRTATRGCSRRSASAPQHPYRRRTLT